MTEESRKDWNKQLEEWFTASGKTIPQLSNESGIPRGTLGDYISGRITTLDKISPDRRKTLYELTGLEVFYIKGVQIEFPKTSSEKSQGPTSRRVDDAELSRRVGARLDVYARQAKEGIDALVGEATTNLTGLQKLDAGALKSQRYSPTVKQRTEGVMELLDVLAEEIDYFRTATSEEKKVLVDRLQRDPESFGYISQMLNVIYSGKGLDNWMLLSQPPSKIKRATKKYDR